ncbi:AIPR family protein [Actinomadura verrucosospora]|uniref:Abortive phage infection n=1 Tax=Actinomadura verrucosospora TaxID=46165 RepID=A0A7D3ZPD3_ACTVE|nr:AIPR family protein [Actinomadura verrucosospora]QKG25581.1 abortive phage infection [Actinomadura verrucosospora]
MAYPVQVRNLKRQLGDRFRPLIDMSDWHGRPDEEQAFLSRAVAALAVKLETACSDEDAARSVIDCATDRGIDAVAVEQRGERHHITLVQAKWSEKGEAGFGEADVSAVIRGLDYLLELKFDRFGSKIDRHAATLEEALNTPCKVVLVLALVTGTDLHPNTRGLLEEEIEKRNLDDDLVGYRVITLRDMYREILGERGERKVDLDVQIEGLGRYQEPFVSYYGTVSAEEVAGWYAEHGRHLTSRNIRDALDISDVNEKIRSTLVREPEVFWYLSNGITLICERARKHGKGAPMTGGAAGFRLEGASVINGAQTVSAIYRAVQQKPGKAALGRVLVRIISLDDAPEDFGDRITLAANTQNPTEARDFRSRRPEQSDLRYDFALSLGLTYVIRRGEPEPSEGAGCGMTEAALALAAAQPSVGFAVKAKRDASALWEDRYYRPLFGGPPSAHRVWRCVLLLRAVRKALDTLKENLTARPASAATHGDLLLAHVLFQTMETGDIDAEGKEAAAAWEARFREVPERVRKTLGWMVAVIDGAFGSKSHISTAVRSADRAEQVARRLYEHALGGQEPPSDTETLAYQGSGGGSRRRPPAVHLIVDAGLIDEGTVLEFRPAFSPERRHLPRWIEENPDRAKAVWRNNKAKPLVWSADGKAYAPSTLVRDMRTAAMGNTQQVQGTLHWHEPGGLSLAQLADIAREMERAAGDPDEID